MRAYLLLLAAVAVLAGCAEDSEPNPEDVAPAPTNETAEPPLAKVDGQQQVQDQSFQVGGSWQGAVDVQNAGGLSICSLPSADCHTWNFQVDAARQLVATLAWGVPANDLDLYLFDGAGNELSRDGINQIGEVPGTSQVLTYDELTPGSYQLIVVPWSAVNESYTLDADLS